MATDFFPFRLQSKTALTARIAAFEFTSDAPLPVWQAGAHVDVDLGQAGVRSYSIVDLPGDDGRVLRLTVQREEAGTGGSAAMHALEVGAEVQISAPKTSFALVDAPEPILLLAGGIGVTPLVSMATAQPAATMLYAGRSAAEMAYTDALRDILGAGLHLHPDDAHPIDLTAALAARADHRVYICGPKGYIDAARAAAEAAGIPGERVHVELFIAPEAQADDGAFEVQIGTGGDVITVGPDQSIIEALEAVGHDVMYDCQRGDCGICQTDVLDGTPDHRDVVLSDAERASGKVMQICVSRALSPRLVLDL